MFEQLEQNHLDILEQNLIVPLAVGDILKHDLPIEPEMQYGLHMALSEIDPDSALLAIALCALDLAEKFYLEVPIAAALKKEARDIIGNYAPNWIHHHNHGPMTTEIYNSILSDVPEDLEALADIMDALAADIDPSFSSVNILIEILSIQARAHMEISEYLLLEIEVEHATDTNFQNNLSVPKTEKSKSDNIILFPVDRIQ